MMKRKLFILSILCLGLLTMAFANDGDKNKKASSSGKKTTVTASKKAKGVSKKKIFRDTIQAAGKVSDQGDVREGFSDLFEVTNSVNGIRLNPKAVSFVQDYMETNSKDLLKMKDWARPYFNMINTVFTQNGLPTELKYLAVIESQLKSTAVSWVGAVGPWQFMPGTARILGLKVTRKIDERTNYFKSTNAAARYLKDLYNEFGDWLLVIAAYNGGPGYVYSAIRKSGSRNFWSLQYYLPNETRNHVKKFIGTHYIFEGQGGITTLTKTETAEQIGAVSQLLATKNLSSNEQANSKSVKVSGKYHSAAITKYIMMDIDEFLRYNPNFDKVMATADNCYQLKLPVDKMELFINNKYLILNESVQILLSSATVSTASINVTDR